MYHKMRLTSAYSKIKKRNLVLINNATYQRETLSERPIRQPLSKPSFTFFSIMLYMVIPRQIFVNYNTKMFTFFFLTRVSLVSLI